MTLVNKIISQEKFGGFEILSNSGHIYTFLNPVSYLDALNHKELFNSFDGIFADGSLLVVAIRLIYGSKVTRKSFDLTSMAPQLFEYAIANEKSVYIVGSKQEQIEKAVAMLCANYKGLKIVGYRNGYFRDNEEVEREIECIIGASPDFLIVGMGVIFQEKFLLKVKNKGFRGIGFTCGGFIHQTSRQDIVYYPQWIDKMNLRFLYRMWCEPHTRIRYLKAGIVFPVRFIWERLCG